jgi:hypothetical protein
MEIKFKDKQEENIFIGGVMMIVITGLAVVVSIFYSILN